MNQRAIGIVSLGAYVPRYRLSGKTLAAAWGGSVRGGERAVANFDEDSLTMAVEAALSALEGRDSGRVEACYLASTTPPYAEKSSAALLAAAADLRKEVGVADLGGSLRAGTAALRLALDAVRSGSAREALVAAADMRSVAPGTELEPLLGDGAAAFLVGEEDVIATFEAAYTMTQEFTDVWRRENDRYLTMGDLPFIRAYGYERFIPEAIDGLLAKTKLTRHDIAHVAVYAPDLRTAQAMQKTLGFPAEAFSHEELLAKVGNTGTAAPLLALARALEGAKPGDRILVVGYGSGAEALLFQATGEIERRAFTRGVTPWLGTGRPLTHYGRFLQFRGHVKTEEIKAYTALPIQMREERETLRLYGQRCLDCGAVQYPVRHVCWKCSSRRFAEQKLSRRGKVFTFTKDHLVPSPDPPTIMVAADLEGGGRFYTQLTDCDPETVTFEMPVELALRRFHEGDDLAHYFWKFRPVVE